MRFQVGSILGVGTIMLAVVPAAPTSIHPGFPSSTTSPGRLSNGSEPAGSPAPQAFKQLEATYLENTRKSLGAQGCSSEQITVRKSWDSLCAEERKDYLRAVNCLAAKPAKTSKNLAPGVNNRLDDFTYIHINQTNIIHNSGYLLPWHRVFIWEMEQALRNECGYKGYLPYWDTGRFADDQTKSPVFDGSDTSFGGDGKAIPHQSYLGQFPGLVKNFTLPKPAGNGGGCVQNGPFTNLTVSLGPVVKAQLNTSNLYGYEPNPRCLSRDFFVPASSGNLTWDKVTSLMQQPDIHGFRSTLEVTIHLNGHLAIGGDGADPFTPSNDPAFYLLHSQIDRLWAIWQGQDIKSRTYAIDGFRTFFGIPLASAPNVPPSNATISDTMDLGLIGGKIVTKDGMSPTDNGRCYIYV